RNDTQSGLSWSSSGSVEMICRLPAGKRWVLGRARGHPVVIRVTRVGRQTPCRLSVSPAPGGAEPCRCQTADPGSDGEYVLRDGSFARARTAYSGTHVVSAWSR